MLPSHHSISAHAAERGERRRSQGGSIRKGKGVLEEFIFPKLFTTFNTSPEVALLLRAI